MGLIRMFRALLLGSAMLSSLGVGAGAQAQTGHRLLVVEQVGCAVCAQFHREIVPAYNASPEADIAPLVFVDLRGDLPEGVVLATRPFVTPTFVLIDPQGQEIGRITGYPGDIFFWSLLEEILDLRAETNS